jgi:hemerythrin-like domain-containing protein
MWKTLYTACEANARPRDMSLREFIDEGLMLCRYLSGHHGIEETYFFPLLARKMPEFRKVSASPSGEQGGDERAAHLLRQHELIHAGMDQFEEYLQKCRSGETELDLRALKAKMDTWGEVLHQHLDDEVRCLGAENMRRYWSLDEIKSLPI